VHSGTLPTGNAAGYEGSLSHVCLLKATDGKGLMVLHHVGAMNIVAWAT
jgi:hypothetical protein